MTKLHAFDFCVCVYQQNVATLPKEYLLYRIGSSLETLCNQITD